MTATNLQMKIHQHCCTSGTVSRHYRVSQEIVGEVLLGHFKCSSHTQLAGSLDSSYLITKGDLLHVVCKKRCKADEDNDTEQNKALLQMKQGIILLKKEVERLRTGVERTQQELTMTKEECERR